MKGNALNKGSKLEREGRGPFLCCTCSHDRSLRNGIISHMNSEHKHVPFNICQNQHCLRAVFLEPKKEHIHVTHVDLDAFFAAGGLPEDGKDDVSMADVLASLVALKRRRQRAAKNVEADAGKKDARNVEVDVSKKAEKVAGDAGHVAAGKKEKKGHWNERMKVQRETVRRFHNLLK